MMLWQVPDDRGGQDHSVVERCGRNLPGRGAAVVSYEHAYPLVHAQHLYAVARLTCINNPTVTNYSCRTRP